MSEEMKQKAVELARLMEDSKGSDVVLLDISELNSWTDYFIIVTITSTVQWQGMFKAVKEYAKTHDLEVRESNRHGSEGSDWNLIDLGSVVIHLMSADARTFYDLEKLWHAGQRIEIGRE
ncbi:MAG: ribosome silencing factor [Treponema sp.]|nr:ribosome silencing factor [Treponema sp.]